MMPPENHGEKSTGEKPSFKELLKRLAATPSGTLSLRKENLDLEHIRALAEAHPHQLRMGGTATWPAVALTK